MKKIFLLLVLLTISVTYANNEVEQKIDFESKIENINTKYSEEKVTIVLDVKKSSVIENYTLNFNSIKDYNNFDENQINSFFDGEEDVCTVTATVTVSVTVEAGAGVVGGSVTTSVSASVTASCSEIAGAVRALKKSLLAAIK